MTNDEKKFARGLETLRSPYDIMISRATIFFIIVVIIYWFIDCRCSVGNASVAVLKTGANKFVNFRRPIFLFSVIK